MSNNSDPYEISDGRHVMLMYAKEDRVQVASYWINRALEDGHVCIYASVHVLDQSHQLSIEKLSDKKNCKREYP